MIVNGSILPGSPVALLARVEDEVGVLLDPDNVLSVTAVVTDLLTDSVGSSVTLDVPSTVYATLQINDLWTADTTGFNVSCRLDGSHFPSSATTYQVVVTITPTVGSGASTAKLAWALQTDQLF